MKFEDKAQTIWQLYAYVQRLYSLRDIYITILGEDHISQRTKSYFSDLEKARQQALISLNEDIGTLRSMVPGEFE